MKIGDSVKIKSPIKYYESYIGQEGVIVRAEQGVLTNNLIYLVMFQKDDEVNFEWFYEKELEIIVNK